MYLPTQNMFFTKKIYINNKPLILTNTITQYITKHAIAAGYLTLKGAFARNFRMAHKHLMGPRSLGVIIEDLSPSALIAELEKCYTPIAAAGGVVTEPEGGVLMIYRRGKWDLPKGKQDEGESMENCAQREVMEETGVPELTMGNKICETYHVYAQGGTDLLKTTHWYHMHTNASHKLIPQQEENIIDVQWIPEAQLGKFVKQSYDAIGDILRQSGKTWQ
jgi:8-oxo-dGTP pyrophosphatase MutT (NUDIX family)